jgi:lipopolysaccharide export system protein LptA
VARGDAVATSDDGRRISADTLVAYLTNTDQNQNAAPQKPQKQANADQDPLAQSSKIERVEAFGHVDIRTQTQTVTGDRGVYVPDTGIARLAGNTHLTQGLNQVNGQGLEVNLKTGIYRLISAPGQRVQGLVMPNDNSSRQGSGATPPAPSSAPAPAKAR